MADEIALKDLTSQGRRESSSDRLEHDQDEGCDESPDETKPLAQPPLPATSRLSTPSGSKRSLQAVTSSGSNDDVVTSLTEREASQLTHAVRAFGVTRTQHAPAVSAVTSPNDDDDEEHDVTTRKSKCRSVLGQVRSRHTWTVMMVLLGSVYTATNVWNMLQMWDDNLRFELVVGPPMYILRILIAVFTCLGVAMWLLELVSCNH